MKNTVKKSLAATLALTVALSAGSTLAACGDFELTSIVITNSSVTTRYTVGDEVSFANIVIKAKFNDGSEEDVALSDCKVYLGTEEITTNLSKITETAGPKTVTIEYEGKTANIVITVTVEGEGGGVVVAYEAPEAYSSYKDATTQAGTKEYGEEGYDAQFTKGDENAKDYVVGDDNNFKFVPQLRYIGANNEPAIATTFMSDTTVKMDVEGTLVALDSRLGAEDNTVEYYQENTVYVTAYFTENEYKFSKNAVGKQFELSVMPAINYSWSGAAVIATVNVVDGYNVYNAKQLAVIDNGETVAGRQDPTGKYFWADIKEAEGLVGLKPNAIVIQNDISVTASDVPTQFTYTLDTPATVYESTDTAMSNPMTGDSTFIYDNVPDKANQAYTTVLTRYMNPNETFKIYGNYHALNLSQFPLAAGFGNNYETNGYGDDGSNVTFIRIEGNKEGYTTAKNASGEQYGTYELNNLNIVGNGNIDDLMYDSDSPVNAGGIIFTKLVRATETIDNVNARMTFIPFFPEDNSLAVIKNSKAYDSYNSAVFTWNKLDLSIENCNFERAGGPLILSFQKQPETDTKQERVPNIVIDDSSILYNPVTGQEFWFKSKSANALVPNITTLNGGFAYAQINRAVTKKIDGQDKFNMLYLLMPEGGVETIDINQTQGYFAYGGTALDRINGDPVNHLMGYQTHQVLAQAASGGKAGMTFNAGTSFGYATGENQPLAIEKTAKEGFENANYIAVNYGGFGMFFEFFSTASAQS